MIDRDDVYRWARTASGVLHALRFPPRLMGTRALLNCAVDAQRRAAAGLPVKLNILCAEYAEYIGSNVAAVHRNMVYACRAVGFGITPSEVIALVVRYGVKE